MHLWLVAFLIEVRTFVMVSSFLTLNAVNTHEIFTHSLGTDWETLADSLRKLFRVWGSRRVTENFQIF